MAARRYHRVEAAFWTDPATTQLSDEGRLLALYLMTCPHRATEGLFRLPKAYIADDLGWSLERLAEPFRQLLEAGFIEYHDETSTCLLVRALEVQPPENPNQVKACVSAVREFHESPLIARFFALSERFSERLAEGLREGLMERFTEPFGKPPTPTPGSNSNSCSPPPPRGEEDGKDDQEQQHSYGSADLPSFTRKMPEMT